MAADAHDALAELREKFVRNSARRLDDLTQMLEMLAGAPGDAALLDEAMRKLHGLAGMGGSFGFDEVTRIARGIEREMEAAQTPGRSTIAKWRASLDALRAAFSVPQWGAGDPPADRRRVGGATSNYDVVLLEDEPEARELLHHTLAAHGLAVRAASTKREAIALIDAKLPDALVSDVLLPDGSGYEVVEHLRAKPGGDVRPAIITSGLQDFLDRVEAVHRGADAFFEKPIDFQRLVRTLENLLERTEEDAARVLCVTGHDDEAEMIESVLESAGYQFRRCGDMTRFDAELTQFCPDLVLLDAHDPTLAAHDLTRYARQKQGMTNMPVVLLGDDSVAARVESVRAGADDFLPFPPPPQLLLAVAAMRIERARYVRNLIEHDGLTGLLTHGTFVRRLAAAAGDARTWSLILLDLDHFKQVNDTHGHPAGDRVLISLAAVLRRNVRRSDVVARYGGEELALLVGDLSVDEAARLANDIREEFARIEHHDDRGTAFHVTFSAGVAAQHPGVERWLNAADDALYAAKRDGRNRVVQA